MNNDFVQLLTGAIDWLSVKMAGVAFTICFITGNNVVVAIGVMAASSTIVYNLIRIWKELKK